MDKKIVLYDALLREGPQTEGLNFSVADKLLVAQALDELGFAYLEGGWPGANPKDTQFFQQIKKIKLKARLSAFGMTRRANQKASKDPNLHNLLLAGTRTVTLVGKTWGFHVKRALGISLDQNLELIYDSVKFMSSRVDEIFYDAEHFFDSMRDDPPYAMRCLEAARQGGASCLVLCDTNGGSLPENIREGVQTVLRRFPDSALGIHCHNDSDLAVANSLAAVEAGATQVQGCLNGYGERVGNTNLTSLIPILALKKGAEFSRSIILKKLTTISRRVDEILNQNPRPNAPYVGKSAFTHKGGMHISAVRKATRAYEHIDPEQVGNQRKLLVSDQAGVSAILDRAGAHSVHLNKNTPEVREVMETVKRLEGEGYQFEGAEASFEILLKKALGKHRRFFHLVGFRVIVENRGDGKLVTEATIKVTVKGKTETAVGEGDGPVDALDQALRKVLTPSYPALRDVHLTDFKVRVLDAKKGTAAKVRVLIESCDRSDSWTTVGVSENILEAAWQALVDSIDYKLLKDLERPRRSK